MAILVIFILAVGLTILSSHPAPDGSSDQQPWNESVENSDGKSVDEVSPVNSKGATTGRVFAHYFPAFPISFENRDARSDYYASQYLDPEGEGGKHRSYGGFLRDRPLPRPALKGPDWESRDLETEILTAQSFGIDGFIVDIIEIDGGYWERVKELVRVADGLDSGFKIVLAPDMHTLPASLGSLKLADELRPLLDSPSLLRQSSGAIVVASFAAENRSPEWWEGFLDRGKANGSDISLLLIFVDAKGQLEKYAHVAFGFGDWGAKDPISIASGPNYTAAAHAMGRRWMSPVVAQDYRPSQGIYAEAGNTRALRASWAKAIADGSDFVQLITWNDYSESTAVAPAASRGTSLLALNSYYISEFELGFEPEVVREQVFASYRRCYTDYKGSGQVEFARRIGMQAPLDDVEFLAFLKMPALLKWSVGSESHAKVLPAGFVVERVPLRTGEISAELSRNGRSLGTLRGRALVEGECERQDLTYYFDQMDMVAP